MKLEIALAIPALTGENYRILKKFSRTRVKRYFMLNEKEKMFKLQKTIKISSLLVRGLGWNLNDIRAIFFMFDAFATCFN